MHHTAAKVRRIVDLIADLPNLSTSRVTRDFTSSFLTFSLNNTETSKAETMSERFPDRSGSQRDRSRSPPWRQQKHPSDGREWRDRAESDRKWDNERSGSSQQPRNMRDQVRLNMLQEDQQEREWVAQEDLFVLKQAKKKAEIRVKEGRAKPIDWLTVALRVIDPTRDPLDDEIADSDLDVVDPDGVFEGLSQTQLRDLEKDIDTFVNLETNAQNRDFWQVGLSVFFFPLVIISALLTIVHNADHESYLPRPSEDCYAGRSGTELCGCRYQQAPTTEILRAAPKSRNTSETKVELERAYRYGLLGRVTSQSDCLEGESENQKRVSSHH